MGPGSDSSKDTQHGWSAAHSPDLVRQRKGSLVPSGRGILAAVDLSGESTAVLSAAVGIAQVLDRPLHLIHVIEPRLVRRLAELRGWPWGKARRHALTGARRALERLIAEAQGPADARLHLALGTPAARIRACARRLRPALLVLGESGLMGATADMETLGSVGDKAADTRVLLVGGPPQPTTGRVPFPASSGQ